MEDLLDLYAEPYDPCRPVVCFDETSTSAAVGLAEAREPLPAQLGDRGARTTSTAEREPATSSWPVSRRPAGSMWPSPNAAPCTTLLPDAVAGGHSLSRRSRDPRGPGQPNIHRMASLYGTFSAAEARRNVKRLEFHHTPKPASWLNMAEIEFSVLTRDCLRGRHGDEAVLVGAINAYQIRRYAPFCSGSLRYRWANDNGRLYCKLCHWDVALPVAVEQEQVRTVTECSVLC